MRLLERDMNHDSEIDIYLGLDVGKGEHHGIALTPAGKKAFDKPMPNSESRLRELSRSRRPSSATCWSWWTSRPRWVLSHWQWPALRAAGLPICQG